MGDVNRRPSRANFHNVHHHMCTECKRSYTCNCQRQSERTFMVCRDCEMGIYSAIIHGGPHHRGFLRRPRRGE